MTRRHWVLIGCFLIALVCPPAQAEDTETVLIRNVRMIDRDGEAEDVVVNILIKDGKLDVVTKDEFAAPEAALVVDAQNGVLLGTPGSRFTRE